MARSETLNRYNIVASYPDMAGARKAIDALQFGGVDANNISLLGERAQQASDKAAGETNTTAREQPIVMRVLRRAIFWGIAAAIVGGVLGLILASIGLAFPAVGDSVAVQAGSWALFGLVGGTLVGAYSALTVSEALELTFEPVDDGNVLVGVHSEDAKGIDKATEILRSKEALSVSRFDGDGHPLSN